jgi:hypothetical protein
MSADSFDGASPEPNAPSLAAIVAGVKVAGTVLFDLDALAQEVCGDIETLAAAAIRTLALDAPALLQVRQLLTLIQDRAQLIGGAINSAAEDHGCNFVDEAEHAFADGLRKCKS